MFKTFSTKNHLQWSLLTIFILTLFTGLSFNVSQLIPDIFTPVSILCMLLLLFGEKLSKGWTIFLSILFIFSNIVHYSHPAINLFTLAMFICFYLVKKENLKHFVKWNKIILVSGLLALSFLILPLTNYSYNRHFVYSESAYMFRLSRLMEMGIVEKYLNEHCKDKNYSLCSYVQAGNSGIFWNFLWSPQSPANQKGGWEAHRKEYQDLIHDILSDPKYIVLYIRKSIESSFQQFFTFDTGDAPVFSMDSPPGYQIRSHYPDDINQFISSKENEGLLNFKFLNQYQLIIILASLFFLISILFGNSLAGSNILFKSIIAFVFIALISNSIVCGVNSNITGRYQGRVIWLMPLISLLILSNFLDLTRLFKSFSKL
jgi:hypothetical protein